MENSKIPDIRFSGFNDNWFDFKLKDIIDVIDGDRGKNYPSGNDLLEMGHTAFLNASNITNHGFSFNKVQYISELKSNLMGNGKVNIGDTIITSRGTVGNLVYYNDMISNELPYARINSGMLILRPNNSVFPGFIAIYLNSDIGQKRIKNIIFGSAQPQLTKKDISNFKLNIPSLDEQIRMTKLLDELEKVISLLHQELTTLKQTKQGFLQKMFPKKGEVVPEVRFSGCLEDWKEKHLKDLGIIRTGSTPPTGDSKNYSDEGLLWITPTDISNSVTKTSSKRLSKQGENIARVVEPGTILVTSIASIGKNTMVEEFASFNQQINSLTPFKENDSYFLLTQSYYWSLMMKRTAASATMQIVNKSDFSNIKVFVPSLVEQIKIGEFFRKLDKTIELHEKELEALKETKKAFLQKMFV